MKHLLIVLLICSGCASARFKDKMNTWIGQPIDAVVAKYGPPTSKYSGETSTVYNFHFDSGTTYSRGTSLGGTNTVNATNNVCDVNFIVQTGGLIQSWTSRGQCKEGLISSTY